MMTPLKDRKAVLTRRVPFKLTHHEIATKGQELARAWKQLEDDEEKIKDDAKAAKEALNGRKAPLAKLRREVDSGSEERVVDCYREADLGARCWRVFRCDTDEKVDDVAMTKDEIDEFRQMDLIDKLSDEKAKNAASLKAEGDDGEDDDLDLEVDGETVV